MMIARSAVLYLLAAAGVGAAGSLASAPRTIAITGVNVVDVLTGQVRPDLTVTISGGTIAAVSPRGAAPPRAQTVDGRGKFLMPGLWDMHAHMEPSGESWLQLYVANGVTAVRDMGSDLDLILQMREAIASGRVLGPRIFAAGPILDDAPGDWPLRMRVRTAEDGRAAVQLLKRRGVDLIKVHDHTPREAFFAIAREARRQNLPLAGHVPHGLTVQDVVDAGQTDIEHLDNMQLWKPCPGEGYRAEACRPLFEMLARRGVWQTPTLVAFSELATIGTPASRLSAERLAYAGKRLREMWAGNQSLFSTPEVIRMMRAAAETGAVVTSDMARAGVAILAGCDTMIAGFCVHDELEAMLRGGMTPLAALQTATINPTRYFSLQGTAGTVAPGRRADLVLLDGNPLANITNVRRIDAVLVNGRLLEREILDQLLDGARQAAGRQ
jgi:imidazolonepropionase-like amidohydrolase